MRQIEGYKSVSLRLAGRLKMGADHEEADSLYDILYADLQRIGLLLSHLGNDGVLKELTRETAAAAGSRRGVDLKLFKADVSEDEKNELKRTFDPQWLVPLIFLDKVQNRLQSSISDANLGQLVLTEGTARLIDTKLVQTLYSREPMQQLSIKKAMAQAEESGVEFDYDSYMLELDVAIANEPQIQLHFRSDSGDIWSTLRPAGLITPVSELAMKHGPAIPGQWHLLGIKDANPIHTFEELAEYEQRQAEEYPAPSLLQEVVLFSSVVKRMFGRPLGILWNHTLAFVQRSWPLAPHIRQPSSYF